MLQSHMFVGSTGANPQLGFHWVCPKALRRICSSVSALKKCLKPGLWGCQLSILLLCVHYKSCTCQMYILQSPPLYMQGLPQGSINHVDEVNVFLPHSNNANSLLFLQEYAYFIEFSLLLGGNGVVLYTVAMLPHIP